MTCRRCPRPSSLLKHIYLYTSAVLTTRFILKVWGNRMNFLFHCWEYPPHAGGVGRYIRNMSEVLVENGHLVVVAAGRAEGASDCEEKNGVIIHRCFNKDEIHTRKTAEVVLAFAEKYGINIIEGADHLGCSASLLECKKRPPVVIKCHSCSILHAAHENAHVLYYWQKWVIRLARIRGWRQARNERKSIEGADMLTAPSRIILEEMVAQGLHLPSQQLVVPNPIEPVTPVAFAEAKRPTLLFVGRLDIGKGIQYLPEVLRLVSQYEPGVHLEIVGSDSYARGIGSLQKWLKDSFGQYEKRVTWLGYLNEQGVQEALKRAWVVIVPSRWDTFPTVLLETMAHGKAVVVSDKGGIPEMTVGTDIPVCNLDGEAFTEEIVKLLQNVDRRKQVGASGRDKVVKYYSPEVVVEKYIEMAEGLLRSW